MLVFLCHMCGTKLRAEDSQVGQQVRCPQCLSTLRVPASKPREQETVGVGAVQGAEHGEASTPSTSSASAGVASPPATATPPPQRRVTVPANFRAPGGGKRYGFNCAYCSSRLEATEAMGGQEGACPTCGNTIVIPILDRYGRLIDPITRQIIKQDPHPVHAYAAAGDRAPQILRQPNGAQNIQCPRCQTMSAITSNNCKSCGMSFTMEGTTLEAAGGSNSMCVSALVLGIIGIPMSCFVVPSILAVIFGIIGYKQVADAGVEGGGKGIAIAGMICGGIGLIIAGLIWLN
jgi:LSD1 subclass zinc finger protein